LLLTLAMLGGGAVMLRRAIKSRDPKLLRNDQWVSASDYINEIVNQLPRRTTAWGSIVFGIENPGRLQLLQFGDAVAMLAALPPAERDRLAPQHLVWGIPESTLDAAAALSSPRSWLQGVSELLPHADYRLSALVDAPPYGVTRVYSRGDVEPHHELPSISVFNPAQGFWSRRLASARPIAAIRAPQLSFRITVDGQTFRGETGPSLRVELGAGDYLVRPRFEDAGTGGGLVVSSPKEDLEVDGSVPGQARDVASYRASDVDTLLLVHHGGGPLYVARIEHGRNASIKELDVLPMLREQVPLPDSAFTTMQDWPAWKPGPDAVLHAGSIANEANVAGNGKPSAAQFTSPPIAVPALGDVVVRLNYHVDAGTVCVGVLNKTEQSWLVVADEARATLEFVSDDSGAFRVVFTNCSGFGTREASRFTIHRVSYAVADRRLYVDALVDAYDRAVRPAGPSLR
jgi:hypothetical protein